MRQDHQQSRNNRGSVPQSGNRPAPAASLPLDAAPRQPLVGLTVLVQTAGFIGGQREHAAMITGVASNTVIAVTLFPRGEQPYPVTDIPRADIAPQSAVTWRWPTQD